MSSTTAQKIRRYQEALAKHILAPSEDTLAEAYQIGRDAVQEGVTRKGLVEIHNTARDSLVEAAELPMDLIETVEACTGFRNELFAPFDMAAGGYAELVTQLQAQALALRERNTLLVEASVQRADDEARFLQLIETAPDAITIVDDGGLVTSVNSAFVELFGYERLEVIGQKVEMLVPSRFTNHPKLRENYVASPHPRHMSGVGQVLYALKKDGTEFPAITTLSPIQTAEGVVTCATVKDVTDELYAEQERAALGGLARMIASALDIDAVFEQFAEQLKELIPADRIVISTVDKTGNVSFDRYVAGEELEGAETGTEYPLAETANSVIGSWGGAKVLVGTELVEFSARYPDWQQRLDEGMVSVLTAPLTWEDENVGAILLRSRTPDAYNDAQAGLLDRIASQIAGAIANAELSANLRTESEERDLLARIGRMVTSVPTLEEIFPLLMPELKKVIPFDRVVVMVKDEHGNLHNKFIQGQAIETATEFQVIPMAESMITQLYDRPTATVLQGPELEEWSEGNADMKARYDAGLISMLVVPLNWSGENVGLVTFRSRIENAYTVGQADLMGRVGSQIVGPIVNANLFSESRTQAEERAALAEIGRVVNSSLEIDDVYESVADELEGLIDYDRLAISLLTPELELQRAFSRGIEVSATVGETLTAEIDRRDDGTRLLHHNAQTPLEDQFVAAGLISWAETPLGSPISPIGFLSVRSKQADAYTEQDVDLLKQVSAQITPAISNAILFEESQVVSNQREFLARIGRTITSTSSTKEIFSKLAEQLKEVIPFDRITFTSVNVEKEEIIDLYIGGAVSFPTDGVLVQDYAEWPIKPLIEKLAPTTLHGDELKEWARGDKNQMSRYESGLVSLMTVPLYWQDAPIAIVTMRSRTEMAFTEAHSALMHQVADHIAGAMANARLIDELAVQARFDGVTSLLNRAGFEAAVDDAVKSGDQSAGTVIAVAIERIRELEDRFGVDFSDKLLAEMGRRLDEDFSIRGAVGRIGHDEFAIGLMGRDEAISWSGTAENIVAACTRPFEIDGELVGLDVAVGVSLYPGHGGTAEDLTRMAVLATRSASPGSERVTLFNKDMEESASDHVRVLTAFRQGMADKEVILHYQPKVDINTGQIVGAEALVRWQSPERGMVSPFVFIPVLESSGYMWEFTCWTLAEALEQLRVWSDISEGEDWDPVQIAVNVSARDFQDRRLPSQIMSNLELWGVDPALVEIEVTETAMMGDPDAAIDVCRELKQMGLSIAIDDFGVGQSPLVYLNRLDVDLIKIDRAFVTDIHQSESLQSIVGAMVGLGTQLGMKVLAEGVETEEEAEALRATGCHLGQGYLWARPVPSDEYQRMLVNGLEGSDPGG